MKIAFISDTHGKHGGLHIPSTDLLIHAGDLSGRGTAIEVQQFVDWFTALPVKYKVFIGGNHDFLLERTPSLFKTMLNDDIIYLEDSGVEIEGVNIWGSPISPFFFNWAFNRHRGEDIKRYWELIPDDTDILITHGPPLGYGDLLANGERVGCADLLEAVKRVQPQYHVFGHIHEDYGVFKTQATTFVNASVLNLRYELVNAPISVEV